MSIDIVPTSRIGWINPGATVDAPPQYRGTRYQAVVPATLDLAERARLAVNALTATLDPDYDFELFWSVDLLAREPVMYHTVDDHVQDKFLQALPLMRTMSGSEQNLDVERGVVESYLRRQGPDGMVYIPIKGRPWALPARPEPWAGLERIPSGEHWQSLHMAARVLGGYAAYALLDPSGPYADAARRLAAAFGPACVIDGDVAWLRSMMAEPGVPYPAEVAPPRGLHASLHGWVTQGLAQHHRALGDERALDLAARLIRYVLRDADYFEPDGSFRRDQPGTPDRTIHFHAHTCQVLGAIEVVQANGDQDLLERALKSYEFAREVGEPTVGFFPEWLVYKTHPHSPGPCTSELCEVADMVAIAVKLSLLGIDRWDDVDRWVRNQFAEGQITSNDWRLDGHVQPIDRGPSPGMHYTTDRVLERTVGSFVGWPAPNDLIQGQQAAIMHCCTGNATRALYYVWESMLQFRDGRLRVNLLLNRASRWADIDSHIPYSGRVDIHVKQPVDLEVRLPDWVPDGAAVASVNGEPRRSTTAARYLQVGSVVPGDEVRIDMPLRADTLHLIIEKNHYTVNRRGNDVVHIDPPGKNSPLYQRGHYREGRTLWQKVDRHLAENVIPWS